MSSLIVAKLLHNAFQPKGWDFNKLSLDERVIIGSQRKLDQIRQDIARLERLSGVLMDNVRSPTPMIDLLFL